MQPQSLSSTSLFVLPDLARVEEHLAARAREHGFVAGRPACTLAELERELIRAAVLHAGCPPLLPPQALRLLLRKAAAESTPPSGPFGAIRGEPGFASALEGLLAALTQGLCEPEELQRRSADLPARVAPLARVLTAARTELRRLRFSDPNQALRAAVDALDRGLPLPRLLAGVRDLSFAAILDWTPLRQRLAVALSARLEAQGGRVHVHLPWAGSRPDLTAALEPTLRAFEALGARGAGGPAALEVVLGDPGETGPLAPFLQRLFAVPPFPADDEELRRARARVTLRSCATPSAQARAAARTCSDLIAAGVPPGSIAVAARSLGEGVAEELGAALDRFDVSWRERRGRLALPSQPAQLALLIYELVEKHFPRERLGALLASPLVRLAREGERVPGHRLLRWLREAHVRDDVPDEGASGEGAVAQRLALLAARLRADGLARQRSEGAERQVAEVEETARRAQRLIDELRALPARATLEGHGRALLALLSRWEVATEVTSAVGAQPLAGPEAAALARDQAALLSLRETCAELSAAARALSRETEQWGRAEWAQLLREALAEATLKPGGARGAAVQLVELRELPGRSFAHVIVTGLREGELPAARTVDPLLSDEERRAVNRVLGRAIFRAPAAPEDEAPAAFLPPRQAEEPLLFHLALCAARDSVTLFWPRADAGGREALRSTFAEEALRACGLHGGEPHLHEPLSPVPAARDCRSAAELLARASLEAFSEPAFRVSAPAPAAEAAQIVAAAARAHGARFARVTRAVLAERERLRVLVQEIPPGRFSGQLSGRALLAAQPLLRFGPDAPLSAHQLEKYATCGFKLFAERLLHVPEPLEGDDELPGRERGQVLHACLEAFFVRMQREGRLPLRGGPSRDAELATLAEEADAVMDGYAGRAHVGHAALWRLGRDKLHRKLARLVEAEAGEPGVPRDFERAFGGQEEDALPPLSLASPEGSESIFVRGQIDRIDERATGQQLVLDYKTGRREGLARKLNPDTLCAPEFQLPLYAAALMQARPGVEVDAAYVSVGSAQRTRSLREVLGKARLDAAALLALDPEERARLRQREPQPLNLADQVWTRVTSMRRGLFPVAPLTCNHCDLSAICRIVAVPADEEATRG